jgi:anti-sigma factor RsiW
MNCQETQHWLSAYCDGELPMPLTLEIERHFGGCQTCAQLRNNIALMSRRLRATAFTAPEILRQCVRAAVLPQAQAARAVRTGSTWWTGVAAAAALVITAFVWQNHDQAQEKRLLLSEITDSHIRSLIGDHLVDVASSDKHTVRPWFEGKVDFAPAVPDLSARGFKTIGGRLDYIGGHPAAALVYQCRKHFISLILWPTGDEDKKPSDIQSETAQRGYSILRWTAGGMSYWAISEISQDDLKSFAQAFLGEVGGVQ